MAQLHRLLDTVHPFFLQDKGAENTKGIWTLTQVLEGLTAQAALLLGLRPGAR